MTLQREYILGMERIVIDPDVCNGQLIIRGTRITAHTVLEFLSAGDSVEDILQGYPTLTREDILACISLSCTLMKNHFSFREVA